MSYGLRKALCLAAAIGILAGAQAVEEITVLGLFKDKALLYIDGKQRLLHAGETSPEGVKLAAANSREALVELDGQIRRLTLTDHIGTRFKSSQAAQVELWPDSRGLYAVTGSINGIPLEFLIDTGASTVALSEGEAERLGIDFLAHPRPVRVRTASGEIRGYQVRLGEVRAGAIQLNDVEAVVIEGGEPAQALLGMSFLGRLQLDHDGQRLILKQQR
jgi:aspartyl protease family protein